MALSLADLAAAAAEYTRYVQDLQGTPGAAERSATLAALRAELRRHVLEAAGSVGAA